ncbi:histidine biosynthesis bifunctional protein: phosphoribosyl-AMP cyclohydrolase [Flavobacterium enshiense DK69]|uniref:Histidine biosynthesis bifunctional protein HisIE n=1 Tax=Flavobacterium enshiense DK69 TaxID=1107311 RepID=V6SDX9_9FLAO|nr:bifunctional phosphoribosyl-AMP cyclohydrolase/phosphoribosyl-ATP diphosphatase HisIE [Flavobacterium enshiense]ESU24898.1 histidine biosynthesis bifunctional protein: phosphoribosyl-AMP cyclohydrolase [Flavobacterium enshiense DK69]KGO96658.1 phosphoribosyl-ATP pyrophosphatase [Flavobacterium enshiense DK69]
MKIDFNKNANGLVPAIVQDNETKNVLMLGYMNQEALDTTLVTRKVTFFSRTKNRLWTKGEESRNFLELISVTEDCDNDALLVKVKPVGPTCHTGLDTCWQETNNQEFGFLSKLEKTIKDRKEKAESEKSYVASLFEKGINKIAQKVGEEAVEVVIESKDSNDDLFLNESADLLFHYLILLQAKGFQLNDVVKVLQSREK